MCCVQCTSRYQQIVFGIQYTLFTKLVCVSVYSKFVHMCVRFKVPERIFHAFSKLRWFAISTEREPHVDHYRWCRSWFCPFHAIHAVHDMVSIHWFPQLCEWFSACDPYVSVYHDMPIFTWKIVIYTFRLESFECVSNSTYIVRIICLSQKKRKWNKTGTYLFKATVIWIGNGVEYAFPIHFVIIPILRTPHSV